MKLDAIYDSDKDRLIISYQETPTSPVTTIDIARGHDHHVRHIFDDMEQSDWATEGWEYHFRDADNNYDP